MTANSPATAEKHAAGRASFGGLFLLTLVTLMYEILLTRIFSVTMWYHFAFVAVSIALFGMTVGALALYLAPNRFPQKRTRDLLCAYSLLFSVAIVVSFILHLYIPFDPRWSPTAVLSVAATYLVISVPFFFSGVAVALALTRYPDQVGRLYAADLAGAGLGSVALIWLLDQLGDAPSAVLVLAGVSAIGAGLFALDAGRRPALALCCLLGASFMLFGAGNAVAVQDGEAPLRVRWVKGDAEEGDRLYERWNAFSRVRIQGDPADGKLGLTIDATAGATLIGYQGDPATVQFLKSDVVNTAHHLRHPARVAIVGVGGGIDVLAALAFEQPSITAIEMNGNILAALNGEFGDFTGHLDRQPGVRFVQDEARSYLTRSDQRYDIIHIPMTDTWAATAAGAFALSENGLYTVDAWEVFLNRLEENGVLSVTRWYVAGRPMEAYRLTALAAESLRRIGVERPLEHMMLVRNPLHYNLVGSTTILVSREPFSPADVAALRAAARSGGHKILLAPGVAGEPPFAEIAAAEDAGALDLGFPGDISAPTDDRPFFFQMVGYRDLFDSSLYGPLGEVIAKPVLTLFSLSIAVLALTVLFIAVPLLVTVKRSRARLAGTTPFFVFFAAIGIGFMLIEISQMQRLAIFLGHPTYALSVVLFSLLLASGVGSYLSDRFATALQPGPAVLLALGALVVTLAVFGLVTPTLTDATEGATTPARIATAVAILVPMGLLMGMPFPLGMKVASARGDTLTPFYWGVNGATSVCGSVLAASIALGWGISLAFWAGCLSYLAASLALGVVVLRGRLQPAAWRRAPLSRPSAASSPPPV